MTTSGATTAVTPASAQRPPLARPRTVVLGGVSAGLAEHLRWPAGRIRFSFIVLSILGGGGALLYLWLWALVPLKPATGEGVRRRVPVALLLLIAATVILVVALALVGVAGSAMENEATLALLLLVVVTGGVVAWNLAVDRHDPGRSPEYGTRVRYVAAGVLLVAGVGALFGRPNAVNAVLGVVLLVLGISVLVARRALAVWTELMAQRTSRVREEQRAEIAAHLHDSVLQTLALIQNRAGASSEVARIARAQERELRDWLFVRDAPLPADLVTELRDFAASVELDHPVRIDVVAAGVFDEQSSAPLVAAAREAILNAARHVGGEVSVYVEGSPGAVDVFVRDRGPGVDLAGIPEDRLGIRESIIGRMSRAGGSATVAPGVGGTGTEVHLRLEALDA